MLYFSRWKILLIVALAISGIYFSLPNFFSDQQLASLPSFLTRAKLVLGLDLQGGSHLLAEVDRNDVIKAKLGDLSREIRQSLFNDSGIRHSRRINSDVINVKLVDNSKNGEALAALNKLALGDTNLFGNNDPELQIDNPDAGEFSIKLLPQAIDRRISNIVAESIEVIRRRIDELGTTEPNIQRQGANRILVQVPGFNNPEQLKTVIGQTARMSFHMVKGNEITADQAEQQPLSPGISLLPLAENPDIVLPVESEVALSGEYLSDARPGFDQRTNQPIVSFTFNSKGARIFDQITRNNVGKRFAVVLDAKIITAPTINEPIPGGSGQISGAFTVKEVTNLAILLRAGALPAKLTFVEERSVGPSLGMDSVIAGSLSAIIGLLAVVIFMGLCYGLFGIFANISLAVNILLLIGVMSILQATLTLPGIAGIILTIGMAVDANVLIFERIREELRQGRSVIKAVEVNHRLLKAKHNNTSLKIIEINREDIDTLNDLMRLLRSCPHKFIIFCDDLSFESTDTSYKSLKAMLDGGIEGKPDNIIFYATSNRRHLIVPNVNHNSDNRLSQSETTQETISLSDRFGLWLGFHNCDQDSYLAMIERYADYFKLPNNKQQLQQEALQWSISRGARSGRVAWQFIQDYAGRHGHNIKNT